MNIEEQSGRMPRRNGIRLIDKTPRKGAEGHYHRVPAPEIDAAAS